MVFPFEKWIRYPELRFAGKCYYKSRLSLSFMSDNEGDCMNVGAYTDAKTWILMNDRYANIPFTSVQGYGKNAWEHVPDYNNSNHTLFQLSMNDYENSGDRP
jgi:hypothetical protein